MATQQEAIQWLVDQVAELQERVNELERIGTTAGAADSGSIRLPGGDGGSDVRLPDPEDEDDPRVREALARLAKDAEWKPEPEVLDEPSVDVEVDGDTSTVSFQPTDDPESLAWREKIASNLKMDGFSDEVANAFVLAGPMYLYLGNRDYVMGLPHNIKVEFVQEIEKMSNRDAAEVGRDLLKDQNPGELPDLG